LHTRCYRDWSSDVCSSDLSERTVGDARFAVGEPDRGSARAEVETIYPFEHSSLLQRIGVCSIGSHALLLLFATQFRPAGFIYMRSEERRVGEVVGGGEQEV